MNYILTNTSPVTPDKRQYLGYSEHKRVCLIIGQHLKRRSEIVITIIILTTKMAKKDKFLEHREWDNTHTTLRKYNRLISKKLLMFLNNYCREDKDSLCSWKPCYAFVLT